MFGTQSGVFATIATAAAFFAGASFGYVAGVVEQPALEPLASTAVVPQLCRHGAILSMAAAAMKKRTNHRFFRARCIMHFLSVNPCHRMAASLLCLQDFICGDQVPAAGCFAGRGRCGEFSDVVSLAHGPCTQTAGVQFRFGDHRCRSVCPPWWQFSRIPWLGIAVFAGMRRSDSMPLQP